MDGRSAVIALVGDDFLDRLDGVIGDRGHRFELCRRFRERLLHRGRVALVGALHRDADNRAGLQIDRMLGLVGQMRAPVLHLGDLGIGIARMRPLVVRPLLLDRARSARVGVPMPEAFASRVRKSS